MSKGSYNSLLTRRRFIAASAGSFFAGGFARAIKGPTKELSVTGPSGQISFHVNAGETLSYRVTVRNKPVIETSVLGPVLDGADLSRGAVVRGVENSRGNEIYAWRGVHSEAVNKYRGARIHLTSGSIDFIVEIRVFNDGVGFRYVMPANGKPRVPNEATSFTLPEGSVTWFHDFYGHYEGVHTRKPVAEIKEGEWAAMPVTVKLPNGLGYAAITEAALINFPGMGLQADGRCGFKAVLGHALPVSHPYELRYSKDDIARLAKPAAFDGVTSTPWRVIIVGADLNALVNCDIVHNLAPPPDKTLFPDGFATEWLRPGRAVWRYLDGGEGTLEGMKEFSRLAAELGFEHNVVEGFWRRWSEDQMLELTAYSRRLNVGIWFWEHSRNLKTDEERKSFFEKLNRVGVIGAKIDFFDHEAKEVIDQYQALLRSAAEHKIMLEFHGSNKPAGEPRTWPNELSRESVKGMEYRSLTERAAHNTTLPFTSFLAGHADYTPLHFGERRKETSWAHQIATAAVFTSPLMIYGAHPRNILENPAVEMIKSIPSTWDETAVLPVSEIGEIAAFARRKGDRWYLAILNGPREKTINVQLTFLREGNYSALTVRDKLDDPAAVVIDNSTLNSNGKLNVDMRSGGGFIARFDRSSRSVSVKKRD